MGFNALIRSPLILTSNGTYKKEKEKRFMVGGKVLFPGSDSNTKQSELQEFFKQQNFRVAIGVEMQFLPKALRNLRWLYYIKVLFALKSSRLLEKLSPILDDSNLGSMVIGSVGYKPNKNPIYK